MFKFLMRNRNTEISTIDDFLEKTYREIPGYSVRSVDELRFQVVEFEKLVKNYIKKKSGILPKKTLHQLIEIELKSYPLHPEIEGFWDDFIEKVLKLKYIRNDILHSDTDNLPSVSKLYDQFKEVNEVLKPFRLYDGNTDRFSCVQWVDNLLKIKIDNHLYKLELSDINNLLLELDPSSRGRVHFIKGKIVASKVLDHSYEKVTYYIEEYPPFELSHDDSMALEGLLTNLLLEKQFKT